jgi:hypothetical protein
MIEQADSHTCSNQASEVARPMLLQKLFKVPGSRFKVQLFPTLSIEL